MIRYYTQETTFQFQHKRLTSSWLKAVAEAECKRVGEIGIIFCSDPYLLEVNRKYLGHDYYTDIITFDYCEGDLLSGDLFISVDTVRDNAAFYGVAFAEELHRVIVHGVLHLIGYDDHSDADTAAMRTAENRALALLETLSVAR